MPSRCATTSSRLPTGTRSASRRSSGWLQLLRFLVLGASGFVLNIRTCAVAVHVFGVDYQIAAVIGAAAGIGSTFVWHRHWTFDSRDGYPGLQTMRFVAVYGVTFRIDIGILQALVSAGMSEVLDQAVSQILITPLNVLGHKLWSFTSPIEPGPNDCRESSVSSAPDEVRSRRVLRVIPPGISIGAVAAVHGVGFAASIGGSSVRGAGLGGPRRSPVS